MQYIKAAAIFLKLISFLSHIFFQLQYFFHQKTFFLCVCGCSFHGLATQNSNDPLSFCEEVVTDKPFVPFIESERLGAHDVKHSPIHEPTGGLVTPWNREDKWYISIASLSNPLVELSSSFNLITVSFLQDWLDLLIVFVQFCQPGVEGLGVVDAVDHPTVLQGKVVLEVEEEVVRGHAATREEGPRHPP